MMAKICRKALVSGKVQGVWFRRATQKEAMALGIYGYAKNLDSGEVEVLLVGEAEKVNSLLRWLWQGSDGSRVDNVLVTDEPLAESEQFKVL